MHHDNPFPGMNPFMEQSWPDVHATLITYIRDELSPALPDDLTSKSEMRICVVDEATGASHYRSDIPILEDPVDSWKSGLAPVWSPETTDPACTVTAPVILHVDVPRERWIEIRSDSGTLVTVIELLSPTNKTHGRTAYQNKRRDYTDAGVNVVEIDLLRGGELTVDLDGTDYGPLVGGKGEHYVVCVRRAARPMQREVYPIPLRDRLPVIRVPLRVTDHDVTLDLQKLVNHCYTTGRYWKLDYQRLLYPSLSAPDQEWSAGCIAEAGIALPENP